VRRNKLVRSLAFIFGLLLALSAIGILVLAASGAVMQGQVGAYIIGAGLFAVAAPLLVVPFSVRLAEIIAFTVFAGFAVAMLWAAFGSKATTPSTAFQFVAVLFGLLLSLRLVLALHKRPGVGT
jgi:hypothetical protein